MILLTPWNVIKNSSEVWNFFFSFFFNFILFPAENQSQHLCAVLQKKTQTDGIFVSDIPAEMS